MNAIMQTCIDIEERVGEIYQQFVKLTGASEELREIWQEMADDEMRHAHRIRLTVDRLEMAGVSDFGLTGDRVQHLLDCATDIYADAQEGKLTVEDAVYASVELEDEFLQAHLVYADAGDHAELKTMFASLAEADREHVARLKSYLDRLNDGAGLVFGGGDQS